MKRAHDNLDFGCEIVSDDELAKLYMGIGGDETSNPKAKMEEQWVPSLTPKQFGIFNDTTTPMLLIVSSRFTGKTYACGHAAIRHAYDEWGAVVLVVARSKNQLALGMFDTLANEILPEYVENLNDFEFEGPKQSLSKDTIFIVKNRWGGKSIIQLMSVANSADAKRKIRGVTASLIIVDEITLYEDGEFLEELTGTLGRRPNIPEERQRLIATCNPTDPECWVAERWKVLKPDARPEGYRVVQFFKEDNPSPKVQGYYKRLERDLAHNPTKLARDVLGQWVAVPDGEALFNGYFIPDVHVIGSVSERTGLSPVKGHSIILGADIGEVNQGFSLAQMIPTKEKTVWAIFDEYESVGKRVPLEQVTKSLMAKVNSWGQRVDHHFSVTCIADNTAFNRYHAITGSFQYAEVQKWWAQMMPQFPYIKFPLRIVPAPKPEVSVRTLTAQDMLARSELYVSALCSAHIKMFNDLTGTKKTPFAPDTHDPLKHIYDACTYPIIYYRAAEVSGTQNDTANDLKPEIIRVGHGKVA